MHADSGEARFIRQCAERHGGDEILRILRDAQHGDVVLRVAHPKRLAVAADGDVVVVPFVGAIVLSLAEDEGGFVGFGAFEHVRGGDEVERGVRRIPAHEKACAGDFRVEELERGIEHLRREIRGGGDGETEDAE